MTTRTPGNPARAPAETIERNNRATRWFHALIYTACLTLLATGWWLLLGGEGKPSPLARMTGVPDTPLHKLIGWAFALVAVLGCLVGWRAARTFLAESRRMVRSDVGWFARWPAALITGRFGWHDGHFDPGQRIFNVVMTLLLLVLLLSGLGLVTVHGGPAFVWMARVHKWSTYVATPMIAGHVVVASGILPGYRGVWRSMHLGGRLDRSVALRLWPAWLSRKS
jgi:cytochrome b subunit of formate dehydrogenase